MNINMGSGLSFSEPHLRPASRVAWPPGPGGGPLEAAQAGQEALPLVRLELGASWRGHGPGGRRLEAAQQRGLPGLGGRDRGVLGVQERAGDAREAGHGRPHRQARVPGWAGDQSGEHRAPQPGICVYLSLGDLGGSTNTQLSLTKCLTKGHVNTQDLHEPWTICFHSRVVMTGTNNSLLCQAKISNQAEIWDQRWFPDLIEFLGENQYFQIQPTSVLSPSNNWSWYFHEVTWFWSRTGDCHL